MGLLAELISRMMWATHTYALRVNIRVVMHMSLYRHGSGRILFFPFSFFSFSFLDICDRIYAHCSFYSLPIGSCADSAKRKCDTLSGLANGIKADLFFKDVFHLHRQYYLETSVETKRESTVNKYYCRWRCSAGTASVSYWHSRRHVLQR